MGKSWWSYDSMYEDLKLKRRCGDLEKDILTAQRRFRWILLCWVFVGFTAFFGSFWSLYWRTADPLLKGAPQITLLALLVGLSAYLRQVRSHAVEQRDKVAGGELWNYPVEGRFAPIAERKLRLLDSVATNLTLASPFVIYVFVILAIRALFESLDRIFHYSRGQQVLGAADVAILVWAGLLFVALAVTHFTSRIKDDRIRAVSRACEPYFEHPKVTSFKPVEVEPEHEIVTSAL